MELLFATLLTLSLSLIRVPLMLVGPIIVPVALPFSEIELGSEKCIIHDDRHIEVFLPGQYPAGQCPGFEWKRITLPDWAWLWSNDVDGSLGDQRGYWDDKCGGAERYWCQFYWLAIRNPVNNLRHTDVFQVDLDHSDVGYWGDKHVDDREGMEGTQFVWAKPNEGGLTKTGFYHVSRYPGTDRVLRVRLGYKIVPGEKGTVGYTFTVHPWKRIHSSNTALVYPAAIQQER